MAAESGRHDGEKRHGRRPNLNAEQAGILVRIVQDNPLLALDDVVYAFRQETTITISAPTASKYLREAGFKRTCPERRKNREARPEKAAAEVGPRPAVYGYNASHRDCGDRVRYP